MTASHGSLRPLLRLDRYLTSTLGGGAATVTCRPFLIIVLSSRETVLKSENETLKKAIPFHTYHPKIIPRTTTTTTTLKGKIGVHVVRFLFLHLAGLVCRENKGPKTDLHLILRLACQLPSRNGKIKKKAIYTDLYLLTVHPTAIFFFSFVFYHLPGQTLPNCLLLPALPSPLSPNQPPWTAPHIEVPLSGSLPYPKLGPGPVGW